MRTGKSNIIKNKQPLFLKQKNGYLIPVYIQLYVNFNNFEHLVLMIERNKEFKPFEINRSDEILSNNYAEQQKKIGFMLADD